MPFVHAVGVGCAPLTIQMSSTHWPHADNFYIRLMLAMDTELRPRSSHNVGVGCDPWPRSYLLNFDHALLIMLVFGARDWLRRSHWLHTCNYVGDGYGTLTTQLFLNSDHEVLIMWCWIRTFDHSSHRPHSYDYVGTGYGTWPHSSHYVGVV